MIEKDFDISFISDLALREKQIQQNYRPIIAVHKWFARRPGTLFRGLLLSEFSKGPLRETFYSAHDFSNLNVADPFMGGGTPIVEANRVGCNVVGFDINPMSYWIVKQELDYIDLVEYAEAADSLRSKLEKSIGGFYRTRCGFCGSADAHVKYFIWVKKQVCDHCGKEFDLFPGYLLSADSRHTANVIVCGKCGELNEVEDRDTPGRKVRFLFRHTDGQRAGEAQPLPMPRMRTRQPLSQTGRQPSRPPPFRNRISLSEMQTFPSRQIF